MGLGRGHPESQVHGQPVVPRTKASDGGEDVRGIGGCSRRARQRSEGAPQSAEDPHGREGRGQMRQAADGARRQRAPGRDGAGRGVLTAREGVSGEEVRGGGIKERRSPRRGRHLVASSFRQEGSRERGVLGRLGRGAGGGMDAKGGPALGALPVPGCERPSETGHLILAASVWNPRGGEGPLAGRAPELPQPCISPRSPAPSHYSLEQSFPPPTGGRRGGVPELHPTPPRSGLGGRGWERGRPQGGPRAGVNPTQVGQRLGRWTEGRPQAAGLLGGARVCRTEEEPGATAAPLSPGRCQTWSGHAPSKVPPAGQRG